MFTPLTSLWNTISVAGTGNASTRRERDTIVLLNRAWLIIFLLQVSCLGSHIINGLHRSAFMTGLYVLGLAFVHVLMRRGKANAAKITAILVINFNTWAMSYLLGEHTHIIDFLLLTAIMPLYLFETRQRNLIFIGALLGLIPYVIFHKTYYLAAGYALPVEEQMNVYKTTVWVMAASLTALLFLMYHKNAMYEKETAAKELELNKQKKMYENILEQIPVDIVTFDTQLRYTYINSAAIKDPAMRQWMIGKSNTDYVQERGLDPRLALERDKLLLEALSKENKIEEEEAFVNRKGEMNYSLKGVSPLYSDESKELLCLIGYSLDITQMKQAENKLRDYARELERKNEDLQHFVNATSHDLKSPLRTIASYLQLIERKNRERLDEDSVSLMQSAVSSVKHLDKLIGDIYQYSVADRSDKPEEIADLNASVDEILGQMMDTIQSRNAFVKHSNLPVLRMAPAHVGLLFSNLLSNALKYNTSEQPVVSVDCKETEADYLISVSDNGIGIDNKYAEQIFEIFKRLHTSMEYEGTGVGLAICKKIVESYGGKIWVESEVNSGATFSFSLPKAVVGKDASVAYINPALSIAV